MHKNVKLNNIMHIKLLNPLLCVLVWDRQRHVRQSYCAVSTSKFYNLILIQQVAVAGDWQLKRVKNIHGMI